MSIRAKMYLQEIGTTSYGSKVKLNVVSKGDENKVWSSSTPSGHVELVMKNEAAAAQFTPEMVVAGQEFYVTIEPVPSVEVPEK